MSNTSNEYYALEGHKDLERWCSIWSTCCSCKHLGSDVIFIVYRDQKLQFPEVGCPDIAFMGSRYVRAIHIYLSQILRHKQLKEKNLQKKKKTPYFTNNHSCYIMFSRDFWRLVNTKNILKLENFFSCFCFMVASFTYFLLEGI